MHSDIYILFYFHYFNSLFDTFTRSICEYLCIYWPPFYVFLTVKVVARMAIFFLTVYSTLLQRFKCNYYSTLYVICWQKQYRIMTFYGCLCVDQASSPPCFSPPPLSTPLSPSPSCIKGRASILCTLKSYLPTTDTVPITIRRIVLPLQNPYYSIKRSCSFNKLTYCTSFSRFFFPFYFSAWGTY